MLAYKDYNESNQEVFELPDGRILNMNNDIISTYIKGIFCDQKKPEDNIDSFIRRCLNSKCYLSYIGRVCRYSSYLQPTY